jgi:predicted HAD superfamily phosphohydrolase YqeG
MSDDQIPVRVHVDVQSRFFESAQAQVALVGADDTDAREVAAELLGKLARQVAESIGETLPMGDVEVLIDALADRINATPDSGDFVDEDGDLDLDRVVDFFGGRFDLIRRSLNEASDRSITNLNQYRDTRKLVDTIGLKAKAERSVAGDRGFITVEEIEAMLAGRAAPMDRRDRSPWDRVKRDEDTARRVRRALTRVLDAAGYNDRNPDLIMEAEQLRDVIERVLSTFGKAELWMLADQPPWGDSLTTLKAIGEKLGVQADQVMATLDEMLRATGLPSQTVKLPGRIKDLTVSEELLRRCSALLGVRYIEVPEAIADLKVCRENVAHALGLPPSAPSSLVLAEAQMVKSNMDMLREVDKRIGALVVEELSIQEEALSTQDMLDQDVKAALEHARQGAVRWDMDPVLTLVEFLDLPAGSTAAQVLDKVRELGSAWVAWQAQRDAIVAVLAGRTGLSAAEVADKPLDAIVRAAVDRWTAERQQIAEVLLDGGMATEVRGNRLADEVARALRRVRDFTQAETTEPLARTFALLDLPETATAGQLHEAALKLVRQRNQMRTQLSKVVGVVERMGVFEPGTTTPSTVAQRLETGLAAGEAAVLPPVPVLVSPFFEGHLNPRIRALRVRQDIERNRDVLYVRDLTAPEFFVAQGLDGNQVRYHVDALADGAPGDLVDASQEVRYQVFYSAATPQRDALFEVVDATTVQSVNAFFDWHSAADQARRMNAAARPAVLKP